MFPGEERYIIWPLQPHVVKDDITVKISAMSVIHRDEEELNIPIIVSLITITTTITPQITITDTLR